MRKHGCCEYYIRYCVTMIDAVPDIIFVVTDVTFRLQLFLTDNNANRLKIH